MFLEDFDRVLDRAKGALVNALEPFRRGFDFLSNPWFSFGIVALVFLLLLSFCVLRRKDAPAKDLKNPRVLAICAMLMALNIILGYFTIRFSAYLRVGFGFITQPVVAMLFGPRMAALTGIVQDILSLALNPTGAYIPAYSLCVGISGIFHGLLLYRKPITLWRVFLDKLLVILVGNILLNSIALAPTVGSGFIGILPSRILKNLLLLPVQTVLSYFILKFVQQRKLFKNI